MVDPPEGDPHATDGSTASDAGQDVVSRDGLLPPRSPESAGGLDGESAALDAPAACAEGQADAAPEGLVVAPADAAPEGWAEVLAPGDPDPGDGAGPAAAPSRAARLRAAVEALAAQCRAEGLTGAAADGRFETFAVEFHVESNQERRALRSEFDRIVDGRSPERRAADQGTPPGTEAPTAASTASVAPAPREWVDIPTELQERVVAAVAAAATDQRVGTKRAVLALVRGVALRECPEIRYSAEVGALVTERVARRLKDAEEAAAREKAQPAITAAANGLWTNGRMDKERLRAASRTIARECGLDPFSVARQIEDAAGTTQAAHASGEETQRIIALVCENAGKDLDTLLRAAEQAPTDRRWAEHGRAVVVRVREIAALAWRALPNHAADSLPPHTFVLQIKGYLNAHAQGLSPEALFGAAAWEGAWRTPSLRDILPGCPADVTLGERCPWHVQPDGSVTKTVQVDDGQGGKAASEEVVLPTVLVPLEQEITLGPWGLPTAGEGAMIGQVYAWWRKHAGGAGTWVTGQAPAVTLWDHRRLTALANDGVPVDSNNAREALSLLAYIRDSKPAERRPVFVQPGWHQLPDGTPAFVLGTRVLTTAGIMDGTLAKQQGSEVSAGWYRGLDAGTRQYLAAYKSEGIAEESKALFRSLVTQYPRIGALAGLAYSAMLLPFLQHAGALLDMSGFVLQCAGDSGLGKSTVQRLIVSLAADPRGSEIIGSFSGTSISVGTKMAASHCLPLCFEEPQQANFANHEQTGQTIANILYMVSQGHDRDRGAATGGNRETKHWRSVLYLTGEHSISGLPALEDTGAERRLIDVAPPFVHSDKMDAYIKGTIEPTITANHGHIVPEVIQLLLCNVEACGGFAQFATTLKASHHASRELFERAWLREHPEMAGPSAAEHSRTLARVSRLATLVAAGMMTLDLLLQVCDVSAQERGRVLAGAHKALVEDNAASLCTASRKQQYLDALREAIVQNTHRIAGLEPLEGGRDEEGSARRRVPSQGYIGGVGRVYGVEVVGIMPNALKELLAKMLGHYNAREFLAEMETATVEVTDQDDSTGQHTKRVSVLVTPSDQRVRRGKAAGLRYHRADGQDVYQTHLCFRRDALFPTPTNGGMGQPLRR